MRLGSARRVTTHMDRTVTVGSENDESFKKIWMLNKQKLHHRMNN